MSVPMGVGGRRSSDCRDSTGDHRGEVAGACKFVWDAEHGPSVFEVGTSMLHDMLKCSPESSSRLQGAPQTFLLVPLSLCD